MSDSKVLMDYGYCLDTVLGKGKAMTQDGISAMAPRIAQLHQELLEQHGAGGLGFMDLPRQGAEVLGPIRQLAGELQGFAENFVVLGIGGSALGATAVDMALAGCLRHAYDRPGNAMRLFVADNSDPRMFGSIVDNLDPVKTVYNVISKSGSTAETMSQYLIARQKLEQALGVEEARKRLVFTTDPQAGNLRKLVDGGEDIAVLSVPPNVGGRYSVLSAVGLLPLACAGHDIEALLAGAAAMADRCTDPDPLNNPAYLFACLAVEMFKKGRNIIVMMPYASDLFGLSQWFGQLWAESLGKANALDGSVVHTGQTPVAAVGATDQHSQMQLYMEGPQDKLVCFVTVDDYGRDLIVPELHPEISGLSYLGGKGMAQLIKAEATATATALVQQGRPSLALRMPEISAHTIGQIFYLLELATVMAGAMLGIDPLDQPGVELGKKLTYGLMGREGFAEQAREMETAEINRHTI